MVDENLRLLDFSWLAKVAPPLKCRHFALIVQDPPEEVVQHVMQQMWSARQPMKEKHRDRACIVQYTRLGYDLHEINGISIIGIRI